MKHKSAGPHTVGFVLSPVQETRIGDRLLFEGPLTTGFHGWCVNRNQTPYLSGERHISHSTTPPKLAEMRASAVCEYRRCRAAMRDLLSRETKAWKAERDRTIVSQLLKQSETIKVYYYHAIVDLDPEYVGQEPIGDVRVVVPHLRSMRRGYLRGPRDLLRVFGCERYTLNTTFTRVIDGPGSGLPNRSTKPQHGSRVKNGYTPIVDNLRDNYVGQVRWEKKVRNLTAKELKRTRMRARQRRLDKLPKYLLDTFLGGWLREHPRPSYAPGSAEMQGLRTRLRQAQDKMDSLISFQRASACVVRDVRSFKKDCILQVPDYPSDSVFVPALYAFPSQSSFDLGLFMYPRVDSPVWDELHQGYILPQYEGRSITLRTLINPDELPQGTELPIRTRSLTRTVSCDEASLSENPACEPAFPTEYARIIGELSENARRFELGVLDKPVKDSLVRSVAELKDLPQTFTQAREFLRFLVQSRKSGIPLPKSQSALLRAAASGYLWWKFGVAPTLSDASKLAEESSRFLSSWRDGIQRLQRAMKDLVAPITVKNRRRYAESVDKIPTPTPPSEGGTGSQSYWLYFPLVPEVQYTGDSSYSDLLPANAYRRKDGMIKLLKPVRYFDGGPYISALPDLIPLVRGSRRGSDHPPNWSGVSDLVQGLLQPLIRQVLIHPYEDTLFTRLQPDDIRKVMDFGPNNPIRAASLDALDTLKPFTTAWELTPLSFVVDWFLSTNRIARSLDLAILAAHKDAVLDKEVWLSRKLVYWPVVDLQSTATIERILVGTPAWLEAQGVNLNDCPWTRQVQVPFSHMACLANPHFDSAKNRDVLLRTFTPWAAGNEWYGYGSWSIPGFWPVVAIHVRVTAPPDGRRAVLRRSYGYARYPISSGTARFLPNLEVRASLSKLLSLLAIGVGLTKGNTRTLPRLRPERGSRYHYTRW